MATLTPRISLPFSDISGAIGVWEKHFTKCLIYQHEADEDVQRTHCHLLLEGVNCSIETLKNDFKFQLPNIGKGNELWSWSHSKEYTTTDKYITYMTKGNLPPVYNKGYLSAYLIEMGKAWKDYSKNAVDKNQLKSDSEYSRLLIDYEKKIKQEGKDFSDALTSISEIKKWIKIRYLLQRKPVPRQGDLQRYAYSISFMIRFANPKPDIPILSKEELILALDYEEGNCQRHGL